MAAVSASSETGLARPDGRTPGALRPVEIEPGFVRSADGSALISVGVDWIVFPQAQCSSLDAVFTEVDSFLARETAVKPRRIGE